VAADSVYGVGAIEIALRRAGKGYVLGVSANHSFTSSARPHAVSGTARDIEAAWQRLSAGSGTKGERLHDWAYLDLADLDADDFNADFHGVRTRGLLIRRTISDGELAFFTT
jgi:SRSO17 transposase